MASPLTAEVIGRLSLITPGPLRCILEVFAKASTNAVMVMVNVNEILEGHVAMEIQCLDRIYLNGYVANTGLIRADGTG